MGQTEIQTFVIVVSIAILLFIAVIIIFLFQYLQRRLITEREKTITEQRNRVKILNAQLVSQQETMQFIGNEIHDSVAQKLTLASIYSQQLQFKDKYPQIAEKLNEITEIIKGSLTELHDLSVNLTNTEVQQFGFWDLLNRECEKVNKTGLCTATLVCHHDIDMMDHIKSFILRVAREFIQNSLKHSGCKLLSISIERCEGSTKLKMADNGRGFDVKIAEGKGMGLKNMKRRVEALGGFYSLSSEKAKGTFLEVLITDNDVFNS